MIKFALFALAISSAMLETACRPVPINPPLIISATQQESLKRADAFAYKLNGRNADGLAKGFYLVADTRSMLPVLQAGDYLVVDKAKPLGNESLGRIITYFADWQDKSKPPVSHRAVEIDSYGVLVEGDTVGHGKLENKYRVTRANYVGTAAGIFRTK